jgi:hypothetical protein
LGPSRDALRDIEHAALVQADRDHSPEARALRRSWAQLIKPVYEVDPLLRPSCGGEMRIVAFITDHDVVGAILRKRFKLCSYFGESSSGMDSWFSHGV